MIWGGASLTLLAKGGWGLVPAAAGLAIWRRARPRTRIDGIYHFVGAVLAALPFVVWWLVMLRRHGVSAWRVFWMDQVGERLDQRWFDPLRHALQYLWSATSDFLPWSLLLLSIRTMARWARRPTRDPAARACISYMLVLTALLWAVFSIGDTFRGRYLAAVYPWLAVLFAGYLSEGAAPTLPGLFRLLRGFPRLGHVLAIGFVLMGLALGLRAVAAGLTLAVVSEWGHRRTRQAHTWQEFRPLAVIVFAMFFTVEIGIQPLWQPAAAPRAWAALRQHVPWAHTVLVDRDLGHVAAQLRLLSGNQLRVIEMEPAVATAHPLPRLVAVRSEKNQEFSKLRTLDAGVLPSRAPLRFLRALWYARGDRERALRESGISLVWVLPSGGANASCEQPSAVAAGGECYGPDR